MPNHLSLPELSLGKLLAEASKEPTYSNWFASWSSHWLVDRRRRRHFTALESPYLNNYGEPIGKISRIWYGQLCSTGFLLVWHPNHPLFCPTPYRVWTTQRKKRKKKKEKKRAQFQSINEIKKAVEAYWWERGSEGWLLFGGGNTSSVKLWAIDELDSAYVSDVPVAL